VEVREVREEMMRGITRRSEFAFITSARRIAHSNLLATRARLAVVGAHAVVLIVADAAAWVWAVTAIASLGAYQGASLSWHALDESRGEPREPLARWAYRSATKGHGENTVNVAGVIEGMAAIGFGVVAAWAVQPGVWQLALLALGCAWSLSLVLGMFTDPAFYKPGGEARPLEVLRAWSGVILGLVVILFAILGQAMTTVTSAVSVFAIALAATATTRSRINAVDLEAHYGAQQGRFEAEWGRHLILKELHTTLSTPLTFTLRSMAEIRAEHPDQYRQVRELRAIFDQLSIMSDPQYVTSQLPRALVEPLRRAAGSSGVQATAQIDPTWLPKLDLKTAREAMLDLVNNAVAAGAKNVRVELSEVDGRLLRLAVEDDAGGIPQQQWCRPGSSLARLQLIHRGLGGDLTLTVEGGRSRVEATWSRQEEGE